MAARPESLRFLIEDAAREDAPLAAVLSALESLAWWSHGCGVSAELRSGRAADRELFLTSGALGGLLTLVLSHCPLSAWRTSERAFILTASIFRFGPAGQVVLAVDRALRQIAQAAGEAATRIERTRWLAFALFERNFVRVPGRVLAALVGVRHQTTEPYGWMRDHGAAPDEVLRCLVAIPELVTNALQRALPESCGLHLSRYPCSLAWAVAEWLHAHHDRSTTQEPMKPIQSSAPIETDSSVAPKRTRLGTLNQECSDAGKWPASVRIKMRTMERLGAMPSDLVSEMVGKLARQLCRRGLANAWCRIAVETWLLLERQSCRLDPEWRQDCLERFTNVPDHHVAMLMEELAQRGYQGTNQERGSAVTYLRYLCHTREAAVTFVSCFLPASTPKITSVLSPVVAEGEQRVLRFLLQACATAIPVRRWRAALALALQRWCDTAQSAARWEDDIHTTRMILFLAQFSRPETSVPGMFQRPNEEQEADWVRLLGKGLEAHLASALPEMHYHGMLVAETLSDVRDLPEKKLRFAIAEYEAWKTRDPEALRPWIAAELESQPTTEPGHGRSGFFTRTSTDTVYGPEAAQIENAFRENSIKTTAVSTTCASDDSAGDDDDLQPYPLPPEELAIDPNEEPREDIAARPTWSSRDVPSTFETLSKALATCLRRSAGDAPLGPSSSLSSSSLDREASAAKSDTVPVQALLTQLGRLLEHNVNGLDHWALPLLRLLRQIRASKQPPDEYCTQLMRQIACKAFASTGPSIAQLIFVQNITLRERSEWLSLLSESVTDLVQTRYVAPKSAPTPLEAPSSDALTKRVGGYTRRLSIRSLLLAHRRETNQLSGPGHDQGRHDTALKSNVESMALLDGITKVFFELMARSDTNEAWLDLRRRDQSLLAQLLQTASMLLYSAQGPASVCVGAAARLVSMSQALAEVAYGARTCTDVAVHRAVALALRCVGEVLGQVIWLYSIRRVHELIQLWESDNGGCVVSLVQMMDLLARWSKDEPDEATRHAASVARQCFGSLSVGLDRPD